MEFEGVESVSFPGRGYAEDAYRFGLARRHQGDEYYDGACGAPIAGRDGQIVSIVIGGNRDRDCLYGLPLSLHRTCLRSRASASLRRQRADRHCSDNYCGDESTGMMPPGGRTVSHSVSPSISHDAT